MRLNLSRQSQIGHTLPGLGGGLVVAQFSRLGDQLLRGGGAHLRQVQDQRVLPWVALVGAEQGHQPARTRFFHMLDVTARGFRVESLALAHLGDAIVYRRR